MIRRSRTEAGLFFRRIFACLLLAALAAGCAVTPKGPSEVSEAMDADEWIGAQKSRLRYWDRYQGELRTRIESDKGRYSMHSLILVSMPGRVRMETRAITGQTLGVFVSSPGRAAVWDASENRMFTAREGETVVDRFFGVSLAPSLLSHLLVATLPREYLEQDWKITCRDGECRAFWKRERAGKVIMCEFTRSPFALKSIRMIGPPRDIKVSYQPAVIMNPGTVPEKVTVTSPGWKIENRVRRLEKRQEALAPEVFKASFPSDPRIIPLDGV